MWSDFEIMGSMTADIAMCEAKQEMNDYRRIRKSPHYGKLRPAHTRRLHLSSRHWLERELDRDWKGSMVVVSHHAPTVRSLDPKYPLDYSSGAYASRLDEFIQDRPIDLWIHGHTHCRVDSYIGGTRVLSNQRGYSKAGALGFDEHLVVEIRRVLLRHH